MGGGHFFRPDLTAFDHEVYQPARLLDDPLPQAAVRKADAARPAGTVRREDAPSKRPALLKPVPGRNSRAVALPAAIASKADTSRKSSARQIDKHAEHSTKSRLDGPHAHCKERPADSKRRGKGSGKREFVPWCDRRRK